LHVGKLNITGVDSNGGTLSVFLFRFVDMCMKVRTVKFRHNLMEH
jgi:hypothetical protein